MGTPGNAIIIEVSATEILHDDMSYPFSSKTRKIYWDVTYVLPTFRDSLSVPSSR
jgi:hypothetical protein